MNMTLDLFRTEDMHALEHRIPPPVVALLIAMAMWGVAQGLPALQVPGILRFGLANTLFAVGIILAALGIRALRQARTTINPVQPELAAAIVTSGVYRYTRNPMYVGLAGVLTGWAAFLAVPWTLFGPVVFVLFITRFQIIPEENALGLKFSLEYGAYKNKVRRWL
jgi:protein-S-isoprenylcysteine O-methyltransferase Ste14